MGVGGGWCHIADAAALGGEGGVLGPAMSFFTHTMIIADNLIILLFTTALARSILRFCTHECSYSIICYDVNGISTTAKMPDNQLVRQVHLWIMDYGYLGNDV